MMESAEETTEESPEDAGPAMAVRLVISKRIRIRREELDLSSAQLGRAISVGRQVIGHWEKASQKPREDKMLQLSKVLKTSISYLYGETDDPRPAPDWGTNTGPSSAWEAKVGELQALVTAMAKILNIQTSQKNDAELEKHALKQDLKERGTKSLSGATLHPEVEELLKAQAEGA